ncbi:phosphatase PAP2 family protein [Kitasatospora phosalacinea]|uniref:phosphatase PAP2 family protein n=1 Tax=Kitasatospora phosalacinea TaxID=2065 RepID=UPI0012FEFAE5|nr:phosphatase PAP2 family protein [Kitasatospora phosalacinea]
MHQPIDRDPRAAAGRPDGGRRTGRSPARPPVQRARASRCAWPALAGALVFAVLLVMVKADWAPLARFDQGWVSPLHRYALRHPVWTAAMRTLADLGAPWVMRAALGAVAGWLWVRGARALAGWSAAAALLGWAVGGVGRELIGRPRPHLADPVALGSGAAFPAGPALASAVTCGALLALVWPRIERPARAAAGTAAALAVLAVGWTGIALGAHRPSDVLASWAAAAAVLAGPALAVELWRPGRLDLDVRLLRRRAGPRVQRVLASRLEPAEPLAPVERPGPVTERDPGRS